MKKIKILNCLVLGNVVLALISLFSFTALAATNVPPPLNLGTIATGGTTVSKILGNECGRPDAGSIVLPPKDIYSANGVLNASLSYYTSLDANNNTLFCFVTPEGDIAPTFHLKPGDVFK